MAKQTVRTTITIPAQTIPVEFEVDIPEGPGGGGNGNGGGNGGGPGPEPGGSWARDILGTGNPLGGLNGPQLTQRAQQRQFDSLLDPALRERTDLQAQIDRAPANGECVLEAGIYRAQANVTKALHIKGNRQVSIRASDNWSPGGSAGCTWNRTNNIWTSSLALPNWTPEPVQPFEVHDAWKAARAWVVMLDGQRLYIEQGTGQPTAGHFRIDGQRRVILRDDPNGRLVEVTTRGGGAGSWLNITVDNVILDGLDFRHAGSGVARWNALESNGRKITYANSMFGWCHGYGPAPGGSTDSVVENCVFHNSGVGGQGAPNMRNLRVRNNVYFNSGYGEGWDRTNGSGGIKTIGCNGTLYEGNAAWNNNFSGLWDDIDCQNTRFANNVCWDNGANSIHYEISRNSVIEGNVCFRTPNFRGPNMQDRTIGIYVSSSTRVRVANNIMLNLPSCLEVRAMNRGDQPEGQTARDIVCEGNICIGRGSAPDQSGNWGSDFLLTWVDNGGAQGGSIINQTSNVARNQRYGVPNRDAANRWYYQDGRDIWLSRIADLQALNSGRINIGSGASYLSDAERTEHLRKFGLE